jgi:Domain of unknown function (DUF4262)
MAFPTLKQTLRALRDVKSSPNQTVLDCLLALLHASYDHASYDDDQISKYEKLSDQYSDAIDGNELQQDIVLAMRYLRSCDVTELIPALIGYFKEDDQFYELGHAMISLAFPRKRSTVSSEALTDMQREVLTALTGTDAIWSSDGTLAALLKVRGLPTTKSKAQQLVTKSQKEANILRAVSDRRVANHVRKYGCHVVSVFDPEDKLPTFTYSIGIQATTGAPEAIVIGLSPDLGHFLINEYNDQVRQGVKFERGVPYADFLEGFNIYVEPVQPKLLTEYTLGCTRFYKGEAYSVVQLIYPTTSGVWPWSSGASKKFKALQPLLGRQHPYRK